MSDSEGASADGPTDGCDAGAERSDQAEHQPDERRAVAMRLPGRGIVGAGSRDLDEHREGEADDDDGDADCEDDGANDFAPSGAGIRHFRSVSEAAEGPNAVALASRWSRT